MPVDQEPIEQLRTTLNLLRALKELAITQINFPLACVYRDAIDGARKALAVLEAGTAPYEGEGGGFVPAEEVLRRLREREANRGNDG